MPFKRLTIYTSAKRREFMDLIKNFELLSNHHKNDLEELFLPRK
jgi:hypothetical protein